MGLQASCFPIDRLFCIDLTVPKHPPTDEYRLADDDQQAWRSQGRQCAIWFCGQFSDDVYVRGVLEILTVGFTPLGT